MFVLKCLRCSNIRVPSHDEFMFRRFSPSSITRSVADEQKNRFLSGPKWTPTKQPQQAQEYQQAEEHNDAKELHAHWQFEPFYDMIIRRRQEALRSIVIGFDTGAEVEAISFLKSLPSRTGQIFYRLGGTVKNYVLVEFSSVPAANHVLLGAVPETSQSIQSEGRVLFLKRTGKEYPKEKVPIRWNSLTSENNFISPAMKDCRSVDKIMDAYLKNVQICDLTTRLHFMTCVQIERIFLGGFPKVRAIPFGSSVNGFGRKGSDLDISLLFNHKLTFSRSIPKQEPEQLVIRPFQGGKTARDMLNLCASMLTTMLPSCSDLTVIPMARVPIVKFKDVDTGCECDLNLSGPLGICMSEMLYTFSCWDDRCRPLLFTLRAWAMRHHVTVAGQSHKISNFSLLLLVIFFLQTKSVLPTIQEMEQLADDRDLLVYQGEPHLFLRHVTPQKIEEWKRVRGGRNNESLSQLLWGFFTYYASFKFESLAITISTGKVFNSPTRDAMYIVNPLEETHNVTRNVRSPSVTLFKSKCEQALSLLSYLKSGGPLKTWTSLFDEESTRRRSSNIIAQLFDDDAKSARSQRK